MLHRLLIIFLLLYAGNRLLAQESRRLSGSIKDARSGKALPFASVAIKSAAIGTATNDEGEWDILIPEKYKSDSLFFSYMGYSAKSVLISSIKSKLDIKLEPQSFSLSEVVVKPLPPTWYIKQAIKNIRENYPSDPFSTVAYYRTRIWENNVFIKDAEAVFLSYHPTYLKKAALQHQILLFRKGKEKELEFMKDRYFKEQAKEKKKALKRGESFEEEDLETMLDLDGPELVLGLNFIKEKEHFLDSTKFKKFSYKFEKPTIYQGREVMVISFESKKVVGYQRSTGKVFIDPENFAIVEVAFKSKVVLPLLARPILFAMGLEVENPTIWKKYNYKLYNGKWYPNYMQLDGIVDMTKKHLFKANQESDFKIENVFLINSIESKHPKEIPLAKRFNDDKKMAEQVFPESGYTWESVNTIKK